MPEASSACSVKAGLAHGPAAHPSRVESNAVAAALAALDVRAPEWHTLPGKSKQPERFLHTKPGMAVQGSVLNASVEICGALGGDAAAGPCCHQYGKENWPKAFQGKREDVGPISPEHVLLEPMADS